MAIQEMTIEEIESVSGGTTVGAALTLGVTVVAVGAAAAGAVVAGGVAAGVIGVVGMGVAAVGGLVYAYDTLSDMTGGGANKVGHPPPVSAR